MVMRKIGFSSYGTDVFEFSINEKERVRVVNLANELVRTSFCLWEDVRKNINDGDKLAYSMLFGERYPKDDEMKNVFKEGDCLFNSCFFAWLLNNRKLNGNYEIVRTKIHSAIFDTKMKIIYDVSSELYSNNWEFNCIFGLVYESFGKDRPFSFKGNSLEEISEVALGNLKEFLNVASNQ